LPVLVSRRGLDRKKAGEWGWTGKKQGMGLDRKKTGGLGWTGKRRGWGQTGKNRGIRLDRKKAGYGIGQEKSLVSCTYYCFISISNLLEIMKEDACSALSQVMQL